MKNHTGAKNSPIKPSNWPLENLPGLSGEYRDRLVACGITTTRQLIRKASSEEQKLALANQLKIHIQHIRKWVAMAQLACVPSVGCQYCGLLLHAGIASVNQLAGVPIHRLHQQLKRVQVSTMHRRDLCPSIDRVTQWIQQAKVLSNCHR
ncbi:DUF4332 domain-containing protein [Phormidium sp. CCY1219]|uniref:DUF4332 domain-containing protein n=1 Tax=Phormidium sp. CCY1219 TaxID=2886104 RepID=UPI002D1E6287|nr:DUF4332 domain-containing protein [Phormidium sp. CCY1219]MEB3831678.1 DUF4332 domain-containing protein [Phormidium sp. CCY1219]